MKSRTSVSILIFVFAALIMIVLPWHQGQADDSDTNRPKGKVIFEIGQEDKDYSGFQQFGFRGHPEYSCIVGVDCSTEAFPMYIYVAPLDEYVDDGVDCITIEFGLEQDYSEVVLRLARGGAETLVVMVDKKRTHVVTNTMLGSDENYVFGVYNLTLGELKKGNHTIQLTVADDGKGNRVFVWDALSLFAE
jgi:hypothetical protein